MWQQAQVVNTGHCRQSASVSTRKQCTVCLQIDSKLRSEYLQYSNMFIDL